ncbi:T9SS type A sorting domain-containing protein [Dyadobacter sandarakinus]|uniref:T9SS type A sorting domain-containing protein n=1 Tax=Dyadobacter sandarakinus TaxID=2747268 RepID=A0ABX7I6S2_9BACT|nr:T9SS type A sorting domain-containing protein [Dyadobacter sandarakinus]QRR00888.1 T9SS type A sorting domain-containing protein [Dyadobacter sandarakinus]
MKQPLLCLSFLTFYLAISVSLSAQPSIEWDKTLGGSGSDGLSKVLNTKDGGYIIGGTSSSPTDGNRTAPKKGTNDYWIIKYSAAGTKQWEKAYGGTTNNYLTDIQQTSDGGYMLGGNSYSGIGLDKSEESRGDSDYWVIKIDSSGTRQWDKTVGGSSRESLISVRQLKDGTYILAGESKSNKSGDKSSDRPPSFEDNMVDYWVVKLSKDGLLLNEQTIERQGLGRLSSFEVTADGGFILGSDEGGYEEHSAIFHVIKFTPAFARQWDKRYGPDNQYSEINAILPLSDGGYVLAGITDTDEGGRPLETERSRDNYIVKVDKDGNRVWHQIIGSVDEMTDDIYTYHDYVTCLLQTPDGGILVGGYSPGAKGAGKSESSRGGQDFWVYKLQSDGFMLWDKTIGGSGNDFLVSMRQAADGGYLLGGYSSSPPSGEKTGDFYGPENGFDYWVVKLESESPGKPGTITQFTATAKDESIRLDWVSPAGSVIKKFNVERSLDRLTWTQTGTVTSSKSNDTYQFTHDQPVPGVEVSYRLKVTTAQNEVWYTRMRSTSVPVKDPLIVQWDHVIGSRYNDNFAAMVRTADGGYILGGRPNTDAGIAFDKSEADRGEWDYWIVKIGADGKKQWDKTLGGESYDMLTSIIQTLDGGYLVGGRSQSQAVADKSEPNRGNPYTDDYWVIKLAADGTKEWDKTIGGDNQDRLGSILQVDDGYILAGVSASSVSGDRTVPRPGPYVPEVWLVKIGFNGTKIWDKSLLVENAGGKIILEKTRDGGYVLTNGIMPSPYPEFYTSNLITKLSSTFEIEWAQNFDSYYDHKYGRITAIQQTADDGYILGGYNDKYSLGKGGADYFVAKLSESGALEWYKMIGGNEDDLLFALRQTPDNGYILAGISGSDKTWDKSEDSKGRQDIWIVKLSEDGTKQWDKTVGGARDDACYFVDILPDGRYLLGGSTSSLPGGDRSAPIRDDSDFWIVSLAPESPLPVTLTSFNARAEGTTALLTWQTASESQSDRFEVEHSVNGKSWDRIGVVNAKGESDRLETYNFTHVNPVNGDNYYRLKMMDTDGSFTLSQIEHLRFETDFDVTVYPNPTVENIHFKATNWSKVKSIKILNSQGKVVYHVENTPSQDINAKAFKAGLYLIQVSFADGIEATRRIVIGR